MAVLTKIFFTLSNALLIPVELGLILALLVACYAVGVALGDARRRRAEEPARKQLEKSLTEDKSFDMVKYYDNLNLKESGTLAALQEIASKIDDEPFVEKRLAEIQDAAKTQCDKAERLVKIGPALGLMGTLIPLGPALLGLAQGDLETLASNLVVAFSTTVVGLTIALLGFFVLNARKRWARRDFILLNFAVSRRADQVAQSK